MSADLIEGALVLLEDRGKSWHEAAPKWLALLDSPSDYVRGCAARMLGACSSDDTTPSTDELFIIIQLKELARPGIASPFWSSRQFDYDGPIDIVE